MAEAFGEDRAAAVCRELTKTHEEVRRGPLAELAAWAADGVRGEVTIVVAGAAAGGRAAPTRPPGARPSPPCEAAARPARRRSREVARAAGVPKREVYDAVHRDGGAVTDRPTRSRAATEESSGARRDRERPPAPEPLPHPVVDNHCHLDIADGDVAGHRGRDRGGCCGRRAPDRADRLRPARRPLGGRGGRRRTTPSSPASRCTPTRRRGSRPPASSTRRSPRSSGWPRAHDKVRAVGETGLDHFRTGEDGRAAQDESFRRHIDLAKRLDKTLVIHDRDAHDDVLRGDRRGGCARALGDALLLRRRRRSPAPASTAAPTSASPAR